MTRVPLSAVGVTPEAREETMTTQGFFLACRQAESPAFHRVLEALPKDKLDYRPDAGSRSAAELAWLLACVERAGVEMVDTGAVDWKDTPPPASLDEIVAAYERHHAELDGRLDGLGEETWQRKGKFRVGGDLVMEPPLGEFLWFLLFDSIHHRGQLCAYIRPMGGKVPPIYGALADDPGS